MKNKILQVTLLILLAWSCDNDTLSNKNPAESSINKIMPLGASRVEGARPDYESYRYELWKDLKAHNWSFDFIGTQTDNASYPSFNNESFDNDHEGRGGWTTGEILNGLSQWLEETGSPDIVLFSSPAGNDVFNFIDYNQSLENINQIIDILQTDNQDVTILIEQTAPGSSSFMTPGFISAFNQFRQDVLTIANQQTTSSSKVIAVDMYTGFNDSYLADEVHYNEAGAIFIAERYYNVLENVLMD